MVELNLIEVKKNLYSFMEYNTYVFVQTHTQKYNGYILQIDDEAFVLMDDLVPAPFPVRFDDLIAPVIPSSKKGKDYNKGRDNTDHEKLKGGFVKNG